MLKVTVNGVDHELSPDSPRATSHSALLKDIVTAVNALEVGTAPDGIELSSATATTNVISSASDNTTTTSSDAAMTFHNTVAHTADDLEFNFTRSDNTSLLKVDKEGDTTVAGTLTAAGLTSSAATALAATSTSPVVITGAASDVSTTSSVAGMTFKNTTAHTPFDLEFNFQKSTGGSLLNIDTAGNNTAPSTGSFTVGSNYLDTNGLHADTHQSTSGTGINLSDAVGVNLTGTTAKTITSATSNANASTSIATLTIKPTVAIDSGKLILDVQNSAGTSHLKVAAETGRVDVKGALVAGSDIQGNNIYTAGGNFTVPSALSLAVTGNVANGASAVGVVLNNTTSLTTAGAKCVSIRNANSEKVAVDLTGKLLFTSTEFTDDSANTGDRTVNKVSGINAFAGGASAITITNDRCTSATCIVNAVLQTNDATAILKNVVPTTGSFTINLTATATGTTKVAWWIINA